MCIIYDPTRNKPESLVAANDARFCAQFFIRELYKSKYNIRDKVRSCSLLSNKSNSLSERAISETSVSVFVINGDGNCGFSSVAFFVLSVKAFSSSPLTIVRESSSETLLVINY
jgi:hypothetical protein